MCVCVCVCVCVCISNCTGMGVEGVYICVCACVWFERVDSYSFYILVECLI